MEPAAGPAPDVDKRTAGVHDQVMLSQQAHGPRIRPILALGDMVSVVLAVWLAHVFRFPGRAFESKWSVLMENPGFLAWVLLSCWGLAAAAELYEPESVKRFSEAGVRVGIAVTAWAACLVLATYIWPAWNFGRGLLVITSLALVPLMLLNRWIFSSWLRRRSRTPALVVGDPELADELCRKLGTYTSSPWKPVNCADVPLRHVKEQAEQIGARLIVVAGAHPESRADFGNELSVLHLSGVPVVAEVDLWAWFEERLPLDSMSPELALHQHGFGPIHWDVHHRLISILDYALAVVLLVPSLPVFVAAALLILVVDGRPAIFRQRRLGQFGRPFEMLKLRTMTKDAEREGPRFATDKDPRITRLGSLLRRLRIDEIPQLLNILRGEMSLVGPRPERPEFVDELARHIPYYTFRFAVRPGLTGWAQVNTSYARDLEGHRRKLEFDLYYIRQPSLRLYLLTLLRTASTALAGARRVEAERPPKPVSRVRAPRIPASAAAGTGHGAQQTLERLDDPR